MLTFEELWEEYHEAYESTRQFAENLNRQPDGSFTIGRLKWLPEQKDEYDKLERKEAKLRDQLLARPDARYCIRLWMVDVHGESAECKVSEDAVGQMTEEARTGSHSYMDRCGALAQQVKGVMLKYNLTDSGFGCDCWDLGCHCTEDEANKLCSELFRKFAKAIDAGLISIDKHLWSLKLVGPKCGR